MTRMLARVRDAAETAQVVAAGIDVVEAGIADARRIRAVHGGALRLVLDAVPVGTDQFSSAFAGSVADARPDEICLQIDPATPIPDAVRRAVRVVARVPMSADVVARVTSLRGRVDGVMIDTERRKRLLDGSRIEQLDGVAAACRAAGLAFGLGGGLEAPDVARLLLLEPDVLGFDAALRIDHEPTGPLAPCALDAIRSLIPRAGRPGRIGADVDHADRPDGVVIDRIFVRDLVVSLSIGAYKAERGRAQRVRFSVVVEVARDPKPPRDMRDVFSYDVIIETIRVFAARPHVVFVEALAEDVAAALLTHAPVRAVTVTVEKLDVIDGAVGIEICRRRRA